MKKVLGLLLGLGFVVSVLAGCSGFGQSAPVSYSPAAYGQNGVCYYVNSPAEVVALQNAGLCPRTWVAGPMPDYWLNEYYPYYSSPVYYTSYVPVRLRATYVRTEHTYYAAHSSAIRTASSKATYKSSSGGTVKGTTVIKSKSTFGSGTAGTSFGSGKRSGSTSGYTGSSGSRTSSRSGGSSFGSTTRTSLGGGKR